MVDIALSGGLFLYYRHPTFELLCTAGEASSVDLSFDEAQALFASIASACGRLEIVQVKLDRLSWTTDARLNPKHPDRVIVKFSGALGWGNIGLNRRHLLSACQEFADAFGTN